MLPLHLKSIPYGLSDYEVLTRDNCYYVDKTHFIPLIERSARYFFLIRPRRFGKSLLLNVLDAYYDINNADRFEELFGERWIYHNPTSLRAKFMILRFNFSEVDNNPERMMQSFEDHCTARFVDFADRYEHLFSPGFREELMEQGNATNRLTYINNKASLLRLRIYLIIDEYDNFTNSILANVGQSAFKLATHGEGFYRYFFNKLKAMTTGNGMALERMFITGVSPVTMDDVTSGFNIGTNFTTDVRFNNLVGFSEAELRTMLEYYAGEGALPITVDEAVEEMKPWYDNYCFAEEMVAESMFNSDMALYYLNSLLQTGKPPREMIDKNIRTDYNKLRHLVKTDREVEVNSNLSVIREIVQQGYTTATINDSFSVDDMLKPNNFKSLLYYFGLVTIQGTEFGDTILAIPNHTVREQMYTFLIEGLADAQLFTLDFYELGELMKQMAYRGEWRPVFNYISDRLKDQSRIRQFIDGEAHVKAFLLAYLGLSNYYHLLPEYEMGKGYADFYFSPNPRIDDIGYAYLLEVKYMKRDEPDSRLDVLKGEAREQLLKYATDELVTSRLRGAQLKLITVVYRGWEVEAMFEE